ncbi:portal protein [Psychrobacter sp. UBA2514]|jgi:hypothetical protein|uniref:portal protein n=1 Tax=Psychrobacter sp. UBA2514 TaxID=1947346 RepID=UPI002580EA17|nr:portal protein [Psychrobacter sp. UBA2514]
MSKQNDKLHQRLLERIDADYSQSHDNQRQSYDDRRFCFVQGAQWDGDIGRQFEGRPKFEFNKIQLSVIRIYNEWAKNRFTVEFRPQNNAADTDTADNLQELFRADERDSNADEAYSTAFMEGISGGIGAILLEAKYDDEDGDDDEYQRIRIKPIFEADTMVYWDSNARRYDKADAKHVTIVTAMSKAQFESKYNKDVSSFDDLQGYRFDWRDGDNVRVAEHYELTERKVEVTKLSHPQGGEPVKLYEDDEDFDQQLSDYLAQGYEIDFAKKVKRKEVKGYVLSGDGIVEKLGVIAGEYLPVAPFYGKRMYVSGREVTQGHVGLSRDAQIAFNLKMSGLIDLASRPQDETPIFTPAQVKGHEGQWASKEVERKPYLTINPTKDAQGNVIGVGPQAYTKAPVIPQAMGALIESSGALIGELTGNQSNGEQLVSNVSTEAVEMVQDKVDAQAYIYLDNFAKTIAHVGRIWLSMAQVVYDEESREMSGVSHDDTDSKVVINKPTIKDGQLAYENDIQGGKYKVTVDVGEAFSTQRDKTIKRMIEMLPLASDPQDSKVLYNTILANQDGEGTHDLSRYARKNLINMGVTEPDEQEQKEMQAAQQAAANQPPDAQTQYFEAEAAKALASAEKAKADTQKTLAEVDETRADTAKTLYEMQQQFEQSQAAQQQAMQQMLMMLTTMQQSQQQNEQQIKKEVTPQEQPDMQQLAATAAMQEGMPPMEGM